MGEEWGPWVEHDGKGCPCVGRYVQTVFDCRSRRDANPNVKLINGGFGSEGFAAGGVSWYYGACGVNIIRYRIRKPRGMTVLQEIVANPESELETT